MGLVSFTGTVERTLSRGCILSTGIGGVRVVMRGDDLFEAGDRIRIVGQPRPVAQAPVPGMFDEEQWMKGMGLSGSFDIVRAERLGRSFSPAAVRGWGMRMRQKLALRLMPQGMESDEGCQILCAMVLGNKEAADQETLAPFYRGGCMHAFAVSGLHVGLIAGFLWMALRLSRCPLRISQCALLLGVGSYVILTGAAVPALRAYLMLAVLLTGKMLRRRSSPANTWCFAALLILLIQPWQLANAGFLLSFAVYAAIGLGARLCMGNSPWFGPNSYLPTRLYNRKERWLRRSEYILRGIVIVSLSAWLISLPITAAFFHTINTYAFLTNILIAPLLPLIMGTGAAALLLSGIPGVGGALLHMARIAAGWLLGIVDAIGGLPGAYLPTAPPQPTDSAMIVDLGYGNSCCILGNPGLLIDTGNAVTARMRTHPAIFHAGYRPTALLLSQRTASRRGGKSLLCSYWPRLHVEDSLLLPGAITSLSGKAGIFTIYRPPDDLPRQTSSNDAPIIRWESNGKKLLYVGDASRRTLESVPPEDRKADILILGHNPKIPIEDEEEILAIGAGLIILLPSVPSEKALLPNALPPAKIIRTPHSGICRFSLIQGKATAPNSLQQ